MGIQLLTSYDEIFDSLDERVKRIEESVIRVLKYAGEKAIKTARGLDTYKDRTGNLRSSIGYIISSDGNVLYKGGFKGQKKTKGQLEGEELAEYLATNDFNQGTVLIVVAGMNYAEYVQSKYDVLESGVIEALLIYKKFVDKAKRI